MSNKIYDTKNSILCAIRDLRKEFQDAHDGAQLKDTSHIKLDAKAIKKLHSSVKEIINAANSLNIIDKIKMIENKVWIGGQIAIQTGKKGRLDLVSRTGKDRPALQGSPKITEHFDNALMHVLSKLRKAEKEYQAERFKTMFANWPTFSEN